MYENFDRLVLVLEYCSWHSYIAMLCHCLNKLLPCTIINSFAGLHALHAWPTHVIKVISLESFKDLFPWVSTFLYTVIRVFPKVFLRVQLQSIKLIFSKPFPLENSTVYFTISYFSRSSFAKYFRKTCRRTSPVPRSYRGMLFQVFERKIHLSPCPISASFWWQTGRFRVSAACKRKQTSQKTICKPFSLLS